MSAPQSLIIDWTACEGRGLCMDLLPELLEPDPWGFPKRRTVSAKAAGAVGVPGSGGVPGSVGVPGSGGVPGATGSGGVAARGAAGSLTEVPQHLAPHARRAVHLCPRLALRLEEGHSDRQK
jgi:ferredoxin